MNKILLTELLSQADTLDWFTADNMKQVAKTIERGVNAEYVGSGNFSTLGGKDNPFFSINISLDPKKTWVNGYFDNSHYMKFTISKENGPVKLKLLSQSYKIKSNFRLTSIKSTDDAIARINKYVELAKKSLQK